MKISDILQNKISEMMNSMNKETAARSTPNLQNMKLRYCGNLYTVDQVMEIKQKTLQNTWR